ncbi:MAG: histone deacetylase [Candidatus Omnitrophica bacterium]|nr:histone deacetylase [Candidatus Omnitrophota bacterium]
MPIVFSPRYDISFMGLEKLHPFDTTKYGKIYRHLVKMGIPRSVFHTPTKEYLASLKSSRVVAEIAELAPLSLLPNGFLQWRLLLPMKYAAGGTMLGAELALKHGWSINLSGGYHHAKAESGGGFCFFADIPMAVHRLRKDNPAMTFLIVDLDVHQGNGYESIFQDDPSIHIFDVYNRLNYPADEEVKRYIDFNFPVEPGIRDKEYLALIERELNAAVRQTQPDILIYLAGTDIFEEDPLGGMNISEQGIIRRDEMVFQVALDNQVPILMVLSGGYSTKSADIVGKSLENILRNVIRLHV